MTRLDSHRTNAVARPRLRGKKIAVVASRFHPEITDALLSGALDCLRRNGVAGKKIDVFHVPGSLEIPTLAAKLAQTKKYAAIVTLGAVIRGETYHFEIVAQNSAAPLVKLSMKHKIPITCGILTVNTAEQALERAGGKEGNKGWDAAKAALEMIGLMEKI